MKSWVLLLTLLGINVFLFAQAAHKIPLYVSPVEGTGNGPEDNDILSDLLIGELAAWNFILTATPGAADYTLLATLSPFSGDTGEKYLLSLSLLNKDGMILYGQTLPYTAMEEVRLYIPSIMRNMLSSVFVVYVAESESIAGAEKEIDPDEWRKKLWYIGESVFWSPRLYYGSLLSSNLANFGFGISAEYHFLQFAFGKWEFLKYLSVATGMEFVPDWVMATNKFGDEYRNTILQIIPLRLSYVWRPGALFMHQPFLGIHFNVPLYKDTRPTLLSWDIGFQFGLKAGPGIAYAEARYSMDFGKSGLNISRQDTRTYQRFVMQLGIGYKYDLPTKIKDIIKSWPPKPEIEPPPGDIEYNKDGEWNTNVQ
jgi:hypothetical protein